MTGSPTARSVVFLVWRDTRHPDGGGSEVYVERIAEWLTAHGHDVTIVCAEHHNAPRDEVRKGVSFHRRGGRLTVYPRGLMYLLSRAGRSADVVIDVHNGVPFLSSLVRRRNVHVLVHHLHERQWQLIYPGRAGKLGWWLESRLAPAVYRGLPYVTVSEASKAALETIGIEPRRVTVIHNGIDVPHPTSQTPRSVSPRLCFVGRLVPHKQVEHTMQVVATLRAESPDLRLDVVGDGWWADRLHQFAAELQVEDIVTFHGHVPDEARDRVLDSAWAMLAPSVVEGWGIAIMEAAARGVPAIGYRDAGGVAESIIDGDTGILVSSLDELVEQTRRLLLDTEGRLAMGKRARDRAETFTWDRAGAEFERRIMRD